MEQQGQLATSRMVESLTGWWELAGVDAAVGEMPVDWLVIDAKAEAVEVPVVSPMVAKDISPSTPAKPAIDWPSDIETLKAMIASGASLPGNRFGTSFVAPVGPAHCDVMVISDLPDQDELRAGILGSAATGALLTRMLAAVGLDLANCYWTALATTIPPTGEVPENALKELADFSRHQIGLARPTSLILLGSSACKALLGEELMKARAELRNINHDGSNMTVLTTFHPRTLIARPAMKAQAWKDLQMFARRADL
jgi:uracil-DNA glycosylase family 4